MIQEPEDHHYIRMAAHIQKKVIATSAVFDDFEQLTGESLFDSLAPLTPSRIRAMKRIIRTGFNQFARFSSLEEGSDRYQHHLNKLYQRLIPKSAALAGSLLSDVPLPDNRSFLLDEVAAIAYNYNTLIDVFPPAVAKAVLVEVRQARQQTELRPDRTGLLTLLSQIAFDERSFEALQHIIIDNPILQHARFQLDPKRFSEADIIQLKVYSSGFGICIRVAAYLLASENAFADHPQTVHEILESRPYKELNLLGEIITRMADELGDREEDLRTSQFNLFNAANSDGIIMGFCRLANLNPAHIDRSTDLETLRSFIHVFRVRVRSLLQQDNLPYSEYLLLKVFMRSLAISYVNLMGDEAIDLLTV